MTMIIILAWLIALPVAALLGAALAGVIPQLMRTAGFLSR